MPASNSGSPSTLPAAPEPALATAIAAMATGAAGWTVRCTPRRWTVLAEVVGAGLVFAKMRRGRAGDARAEWRWLHELPALGLRTPQPVWRGAVGRTSVVATAAVAGEALDALLAAAARGGRGDAAVRYACRAVAPRVRRLHDHGLVFRDLYWNHLFAVDLDACEPVFLDVERVFRPRWRWRRWVVKDLAGLLASLPAGLPRSAPLRFLCAYLGPTSRTDVRALARAVATKAARIRRHVPRYG